MPGTEAGFSTEMAVLEVTLATVDPVTVVGLALNLCQSLSGIVTTRLSE